MLEAGPCLDRLVARVHATLELSISESVASVKETRTVENSVTVVSHPHISN